MFGSSKTSISPNSSMDGAGTTAEQALHATQALGQEALDGLAGGVQQLRDQASPILRQASDRASSFAHNTVDVLRDQSMRLRDQAMSAGTNTTHYIRAEPVKSVLMAAATGAVLMALVNLLNRNRT